MLLPVTALALVTVSAFGQPYSIDWYKISGGGGISTNGQFSVSGTIGQPDAGGPMTNGPYSLTGGFWVVTAVQTAGSPLLSIRPGSANSIVISWPSTAAGFQLQQAATIVSPGWANFSGSTNDDGTTKSVTIPPPSGNRFFRLAK